MDAVEILPAAPYDLAASARGLDGVTRRLRGGALEVRLRGGTAHVRQRRDGALEARIEADDAQAVERALRFVLACDEPVDGLLAVARGDALLAPLVRRAPGLRALRVETVAHAALRAVAGQLITYREALAIERRTVALAVPAPRGALRPSPTADELLALGTARIASCGLAPRRAETLTRLLRGVDLERLRTAEPDRVAARLARENGIGPWSIGVIGLHGYGWRDHGLVGDLGLMRLASERLGRPAEPADTAELLAPFAPWRGLASVHLLGHPLARVASGQLRRRANAPPAASGSAPETI